MKRIGNIGAVIVTYNPNMHDLIVLISRIKNQFHEIMIVDNGSKNRSEIEILTKKEEVGILLFAKNLGIAKALNVGIRYFAKKNFTWVATFDQDSEPSLDFVEQFQNFNFNDNVAVVGSYYLDRNWSDEEKEQAKLEQKHFEITRYVITSGAFIKISVWEKVNGFDESLFIDWVDWDFNERVFDSGYDVIRTSCLLMSHQVGETFKVNPFLKTLLGLNNRPVRDHSAFRQYYIFRNRFIFYKRYKNENWILISLRSLIALRELLLLQQAFEKIKAAFSGIEDGIKKTKEIDTFWNTYLKKKKED